MTDQQDRVAVVTGGGRGLGQAIALGLAERGAHVVAVARSADQLAETERLAAGLAGSLVGLACDVTDQGAVSELGRGVRERLGPPTILVNAAGIFGPIALVQDADPEDWQRTILVDAVAPFFTVARLPGRHARGRLGSHRQRQLGSRAAPTRAHQQRLRHRQGGPQPVHAAPRRGDRGQRRDGQRHPSRRRQDRHVGRHPRAGDRPGRRRRELRGLGRLGARPPAATRRTRRSSWCCT